jgi:RNA 3'-terminal phosphate cyclase (ATP)
MRRYLSAGVPVGLHLADQLLPILALGSGGSYRTLAPSRHALTNVDVIRQFADVSIEVTKETRDVVRVDVERR